MFDVPIATLVGKLSAAVFAERKVRQLTKVVTSCTNVVVQIYKYIYIYTHTLIILYMYTLSIENRNKFTTLQFFYRPNV